MNIRFRKDTSGTKPARQKNIYAKRRQKKQKKVLRQGVWLLLLAVVILVLYQRRDSWMPRFTSGGVRHQSVYSSGQPSGTGNFPIYMYHDQDYQFGAAAGKLLVLTDSHLQVYEQDGTPLASRQHTYGNAMLRTAGEYALIYENGGTHLRLETPAKTRFEKTLADPIIFGRISQSGMIAVVTTAETCACKLTVFNAKGQQIYTRSCVERLADLTFHPDEKGCYAVSIYTADGTMHSVVHSYSFSVVTDLWASQPLDTLAISVYNTSEGNVFLLGDTMCGFLDGEGKLLSSYVYPDVLKLGRFEGNTAAILLRNEEMHTDSLVILNGTAQSPVIREYTKNVKDISIVNEKEAVLVQMRKQFETVNVYGQMLAAMPVTDGYDGFLRIGSNLYLRGYDRIEWMDYTSL